MLLYDLYSFRRGMRGTIAKSCQRCRLMHTQEWRVLRLKKSKSNTHFERRVSAHLGMITPKQMDLEYDKIHQNRDHEEVVAKNCDKHASRVLQARS